LLLDDEWLRAGLRETAAGGYENDVASVVAKLLHVGTFEIESDEM